MSHWTPITPLKGGLVHITSLTNAHKTQCGRICSVGWKVALSAVNCSACQMAVHLPVKRRR